MDEQVGPWSGHRARQSGQCRGWDLRRSRGNHEEVVFTVTALPPTRTTMTTPVTRRDFVQAAGAVLLGNALPAWGEPGAKLPQRTLGKTGVKVPILGLGTVALGNQSDRKKALALL